MVGVAAHGGHEDFFVSRLHQPERHEGVPQVDCLRDRIELCTEAHVP